MERQARLERLRSGAVRGLEHAQISVAAIPNQSLQFLEKFAYEQIVSIIKTAMQTLQGINIPAYLALRNENADTASAFEDKVENALSLIDEDNDGKIKPHIDTVLKEQSNKQDVDTIKSIGAMRRNLRETSKFVRQMQRHSSDATRSHWIITGMIAFAVIYAVAYFFVEGAGVRHPLTRAGIGQAIETAQSITQVITSNLNESDDFITRVAKIIAEITQLTSAIPPLLIALAPFVPVLRRLVASVRR